MHHAALPTCTGRGGSFYNYNSDSEDDDDYYGDDDDDDSGRVRAGDALLFLSLPTFLQCSSCSGCNTGSRSVRCATLKITWLLGKPVRAHQNG